MKKLVIVAVLALAGCHQKIEITGPQVGKRIDLPGSLRYQSHSISVSSNRVWTITITYKEMNNF